MQIVRFGDLAPTWNTPKAKLPGHRRWLITYVGGPEGFSNNNPEHAVVNDHIVVGMMGLPVGQRQYGVHTHSVAEIYIILKGQVASIDGTGQEHIAGPLDCIYIPEGTPHAVRNCGTEDVELLYYHDDLEPKGTSVYLPEPPTPNKDGKAVQVIRYLDLMPSWESRFAKEPGYLRWLISWVAGAEGYSNNNRGVSRINDKVNLGMMGVLPGCVQVSHKHPIAEVYVVYKGRFAIEIDGKNHELRPYDALYVPPEEYHSVRAIGNETGLIIYLHDRLALKSTTVWAK